MSLENPHGIYTVEGSVDPEPLVQDNFEVVVKYLLKRLPSLDTAVSGPPTTGTWALGSLYWDVDLIAWRCTVAGTPGTWVTIGPTRDATPIALPGALADNDLSAIHARPFVRMIYGVDIEILGTAPVGASFVVQIFVGGTLMSQQYSVAAAGNHAYVAVTGNGNGGAGVGLRVAAAATVQVKVITASGVTDATVTPIATAP